MNILANKSETCEFNLPVNKGKFFIDIKDLNQNVDQHLDFYIW